MSSQNAQVVEINNLLNDRLFQVIGSTPKSIAESLSKISLAGRKSEGAQIFAISVFAAAVNKSTLETFLADARFATVRPLINAALSIQGRSNMTALTLLGHCLLTTPMASNVNFTSEFRKKMGQNNLWDGELTSSSLSDKQKEILKEKKRLTDAASAKALGSGFLKLVGLDNSQMSREESELFNIQIPANTGEAQGGRTAFSTTSQAEIPDSPPRVRPASIIGTDGVAVNVPEDVLTYRRRELGLSDSEISESIASRGMDDFVTRTRKLMERDPTGERTRSAGSRAG